MVSKYLGRAKGFMIGEQIRRARLGDQLAREQFTEGIRRFDEQQAFRDEQAAENIRRFNIGLGRQDEAIDRQQQQFDIRKEQSDRSFGLQQQRFDFDTSRVQKADAFKQRQIDLQNQHMLENKDYSERRSSLAHPQAIATVRSEGTVDLARALSDGHFSTEEKMAHADKFNKTGQFYMKDLNFLKNGDLEFTREDGSKDIFTKAQQRAVLDADFTHSLQEQKVAAENFQSRIEAGNMRRKEYDTALKEFKATDKSFNSRIDKLTNDLAKARGYDKKNYTETAPMLEARLKEVRDRYDLFKGSYNRLQSAPISFKGTGKTKTVTESIDPTLAEELKSRGLPVPKSRQVTVPVEEPEAEPVEPVTDSRFDQLNETEQKRILFNAEEEYDLNRELNQETADHLLSKVVTEGVEGLGDDVKNLPEVQQAFGLAKFLQKNASQKLKAWKTKSGIKIPARMKDREPSNKMIYDLTNMLIGDNNDDLLRRLETIKGSDKRKKARKSLAKRQHYLGRQASKFEDFGITVASQAWDSFAGSVENSKWSTSGLGKYRKQETLDFLKAINTIPGHIKTEKERQDYIMALGKSFYNKIKSGASDKDGE